MDFVFKRNYIQCEQKHTTLLYHLEIEEYSTDKQEKADEIPTWLCSPLWSSSAEIEQSN